MIDRRGLMAAAGVLAATPLLARLGWAPWGSAVAQTQAVPSVAAQAAGAAGPAPNPGFFRFKLGNRTVTMVSDGYGVRPDPTKGFVRNADPAVVEEALKAAFLPTDALRLPYTVPFLETADGLIAFDIGSGGQLGNTAGRLAANMQAAGLDPEKVTQIIFTHFHADHITGLTTADGKPLFPKAQLIVPEAEWDYWMSEENAAKAPEAMKGAFANVRKRFEPYKDRIRKISGDGEVVPGVVALSTPGHTPGHTSYLLSSGDAQALVLGDVTNRPELNLARPDWHLVFDMDADQAEKTRREVLDRVASDRIRCMGYHFPFPANGYVVKDGEGYRFIPADWSTGV
ncbi:MBL fold metallo-hydrolase [Pseudoroseomonas wenyumeiae]|uniref:MBL fold metallo-hydrolase n=1 Tax=Teichococcus wenyumeiae TaxID=2478470 RepID=A0A3A9JPH5_9PROT|nr:MBL fold metallo-hydrolase [Pseudoroseomonas wenyumeiae]RKK02558.1 MBL fold metallo-hydrolase [Pseudoroseomonas wenyumeiae]RMI25260.1 MBL fold metallo-hydrolase [Pseudoroseomonas wenyumeiae]